jgi:hypothetical protein
VCPAPWAVAGAARHHRRSRGVRLVHTVTRRPRARRSLAASPTHALSQQGATNLRRQSWSLSVVRTTHVAKRVDSCSSTGCPAVTGVTHNCARKEFTCEPRLRLTSTPCTACTTCAAAGGLTQLCRTQQQAAHLSSSASLCALCSPLPPDTGVPHDHKGNDAPCMLPPPHARMHTCAQTAPRLARAKQGQVQAAAVCATMCRIMASSAPCA